MNKGIGAGHFGTDRLHLRLKTPVMGFKNRASTPMQQGKEGTLLGWQRRQVCAVGSSGRRRQVAADHSERGPCTWRCALSVKHTLGVKDNKKGVSLFFVLITC